MNKCYILASISDVLQHQMQDVELAPNIMLSLKEMFGEQGRSARQETMRQIYNTKMAEGGSVREHCFTMISSLNTLEVLRADNKRMKSSFLLEICLVQNPTDSWCVDSGCTNHICNSLQGFQETKKLNEGELFLTLADGSRIQVEVVRVFNLCFKSRVLILEDCFYVPNVHRNLISATFLGKHGYCVILKDNVVIKKGKMFSCSGNILDGLYILTSDKHELYNSELNNDSHVKSLKRKFPSTSDAYLWHLHLGHTNSNKIQRLIKDGLLEPMDFDEFPVCDSCLEGKMTKRPF